MYYATKIKMKYGCYNSNDLTEIDQIYIDGCGWYGKGSLHDYLKNYPNSIKVYHPPYPFLIPAVSSRYEKFVRSESNNITRDNLLNLPRE